MCGQVSPSEQQQEAARLAEPPLRITTSNWAFLCLTPEKARLLITACESKVPGDVNGWDTKAIDALIKGRSCIPVKPGSALFLSNTPNKEIMKVRPEGKTFELFAPAGSVS